MKHIELCTFGSFKHTKLPLRISKKKSPQVEMTLAIYCIKEVDFKRAKIS